MYLLCNIFALVKKLTTILFLLIFLCANTEFGQLLKLPTLIHHFLEHEQEDAGISFISFLHKHYDEGKSHSSSNNEHERLPFKSHDLGFSHTTLINQLPIGFELQRDKPILIKENIIYSSTFHQMFFLSRIWQPPKFC